MEYLANGKVTLPSTLPAEKEMARLLGVGQSTYREALRILETRGFVEVVSGRATRIRRLPSTREIRALSGWPTPREQRLSEVLEALEVRSLLEAKAAALAARRGSDAQLAAVTNGLKDMGEAIARGRTEEIKGADTLFHAALASAAGNRLMSGLLRRIDESLEGTHLALLAMPGYVSEMSADHLALAEAVLSRSPETATQAVITHAARLEEDVRRCRVPSPTTSFSVGGFPLQTKVRACCGWTGIQGLPQGRLRAVFSGLGLVRRSEEWNDGPT